MQSIIYNYFYPLIHPFRTHRLLRARKNDVLELPHHSIKVLSYPEAISMSWFFKIMEASFGLLMVLVGKAIYGPGDWMSVFNSNYATEKSLVLMGIVGVLFFPFFGLSYIFTYKLILLFCCDVLQVGIKEKQLNQSIDEILSISFGSNTLLMIPFLGSFLRLGFAHFYIYAGLKNNLALTTKQSLSIVLMPAILFCAFMMAITFFVYLFIITMVIPAFF